MKQSLLLRKSYNQHLVRSYNLLKNKNSLNDFKLFILTTAVNRPKLHAVSFNNYKTFIPKNLKIKWIINIDYIDLYKDSLEETKDNILNIFKDFENIDFTFILNEKGNFNKAVRNITYTIYNLISINCEKIFYLEDDWFCIEKFNFMTYFNSDNDIIRLYFNDKIKKLSFQPSIIKPTVWYLMFYTNLKKETSVDKDPEKICQINQNEILMYNLKYMVIKLFKDIGRDPIYNEDIIRGWFQSNKSISLSYISKNKLLKSIIYKIICNINTNFNKDTLLKHIIIEINRIFLSEEIVNSLIESYKNNPCVYESYLTLYAKVDTLEKKNTDLKYIYENIDNYLS